MSTPARHGRLLSSQTAVLALALVTLTSLADLRAQPAGAPAASSAAAPLTAVPRGKDDDLKVYEADGRIARGREAMARMQGADLVLWLAGNQFFAMDEVIGTFRKQHPTWRVGVITLPPGLILEAIKAGGWTHESIAYPGRPDVYASVNLGHLRALKAAGLMESHLVYMRNEMQIIVAPGNPKGVRGIVDLARDDVRTSMPNPVNEGIMQFYARGVFERRGLWDRISGGRECVACQATPNTWFTEVHHRETPVRIREGLSDAGIVWKTEALEALREGARVEAVELPPEDSRRDEVAYVAGPLTGSPRRAAADAYLRFLASPAGQEAYARFGFVAAGPEDLRLRQIP